MQLICIFVFTDIQKAGFPHDVSQMLQYTKCLSFEFDWNFEENKIDLMPNGQGSKNPGIKP